MPAVVVSNNARNNVLNDLLAVRVTTAPHPDIPSIVELPAGEPVVGRIVCDEIGVVQKTWLVRNVGGLSVRTMLRVNYGLRVALALYPK
jgi:mRNA interferase MazF